MPKLPVGNCATCDAEEVTLRPNPFTEEQQCEYCRSGKIIGISDVRTRYKLKDADLQDLTMKTEPQPAFLGGPDKRWYLVEEIEERAEEVHEKKELEKQAKEAKKREKEEAKEEARREKEDAKKAKAAATAKGDITKRKRKSDAKDVESDGGEQEAKLEEDVDEVEEPEKPAKRGRGRPPKDKSAATAATSKKVAAAAPTEGKKGDVAKGDGQVKRGRGRPPKAKVVE